MDHKRLRCIVSGLNRYELAHLEEGFIEAAKLSMGKQAGERNSKNENMS